MSAVVPVPVDTDTEAVPASAFTTSLPVVTLVTSLALVAVAETVVFTARPVRAMRTTFAELTSLSAGTGSAIAVAAVVPAVAGDDPATVSAVDDAIAGPATIIVVTSATAEAIAISGFFNEVICLFSLFFILD
jgi:hypothetical protein